MIHTIRRRYMIDIVSCRLASQLILPVSTIHAIFIYSLVCSNMIYKKEATFNYWKNVHGYRRRCIIYLQHCYVGYIMKLRIDIGIQLLDKYFSGGWFLSIRSFLAFLSLYPPHWHRPFEVMYSVTCFCYRLLPVF